MNLNIEEHDRLLERCNTLMAELEELGATSVLLSISCCVSGITERPCWLPSHFVAGDPLACDGLARDYLENGDDDDDDVFIGLIPPDGDGPESEQWKKE